MIKVKFCGLKREEDIYFANETRPDYIGFVFAEKSKRYISFEKAAKLKSLLSENIKAVGVFVNEDIKTVASLLDSGVIDIAQLHGDEDNGYIEELGRLTSKPIIKAFCVKSEEDTAKAENSKADMVLLDSASAGSGKSFDRSLLKNIKRDHFLAGGLDNENIEDILNETTPYAVDVSSGIETNGIKDINKMYAFIKAVRERT